MLFKYYEFKCLLKVSTRTDDQLLIYLEALDFVFAQTNLFNYVGVTIKIEIKTVKKSTIDWHSVQHCCWTPSKSFERKLLPKEQSYKCYNLYLIYCAEV